MAIQLSDIKTRYAYLIGDANDDNLTAVDTSHMNAFIRDVVNAYPFSWNLATADLTLSAGTANLPADYNPRWGLNDARLVTTGQNNDHIFRRIPITDRDKYGADDYVYWITYNTTSRVYVFNTLTQTGTVEIYYQFTPADLSADADYCVVPDLEAIAYGAAAKYWIPDERNPQLAQEYERQANTRITQMWTNDNLFGEHISMGSVIDTNGGLADNRTYDNLQGNI